MASLALTTGPSTSPNYSKFTVLEVIYSWTRGEGSVLGSRTPKWRKVAWDGLKVILFNSYLFQYYELQNELISHNKSWSIHTLLLG